MSGFKALDTHPCVYWLFIALHLCSIVCAATPPFTQISPYHIPSSSTTFSNTSFQTVLYFHAEKVFSSPCLKQTLPLPHEA